MATRRQFLQGSLATAGLAGIAGSLVGGPALAAMADNRLSPYVDLVLFEPARIASARFADSARSQGLKVVGIQQDITPVWNQIVQHWRKQPAAIGGLTSLTPLLLLEQSARDYGLRVIHRAEHRPDDVGERIALYSWIIAPRDQTYNHGAIA